MIPTPPHFASATWGCFLNYDRHDFSMINCDGWLVGAVREPPLRSAPAGGSALPPPFAPAKGGRDERSETQGVHTPFFEL